MSNEEPFAARLHVLVPAKSDMAVVIRRGPSKHTLVLSWNTTTGEVKPAQWLKGRIYERRSDIAPDGKHWMYFAMNGRWSSESRGSWTTVARSPWLKAVAFFPKGDCWNGGGLFIGTRSFWLNDAHDHSQVSIPKGLSRVDAYEGLENYGGECPTVYYNRLMRDGWRRSGRTENGRHDVQMFFEKDLSDGRVLRKICHEQIGSPKGKGCYWDEHAIILQDGAVWSMPDWEWADLVNGKIVFAKNGRLYETTAAVAHDIGAEGLIYDFNDFKFEELEAPY